MTSSDYKLLEQMNHVTTEKYKAMTDQATDLVLFMEELQKKCTIRCLHCAQTSAELTLVSAHHRTDVSFQPYLQQIDTIEKSVDELERTVMLMDEYTRQLEGKFRLLNEREKAAMVTQVRALISWTFMAQLTTSNGLPTITVFAFRSSREAQRLRSGRTPVPGKSGRPSKEAVCSRQPPKLRFCFPPFLSLPSMLCV